MRALLRRLNDSPLGGSPAVLAGLVVWNAGNYAFFVLAGRILGPEDYGLVAALLAVTLVALVPSGALQVGVSRRVAELADAPDEADGVVRAATWWAAMLGLAAATATLAIGLTVSSVSPGAIVLTAAAIVPMGVFSVTLGALQGRRRFGGFAVGLAMLGAPRPVALLLLGLAGTGVLAAMGATAITMVAAAGVTLMLARPGRAAATSRATVEWKTFRKGIAPLAVGLGGIALLLNVDVVVAKLALGERIAGQFAAVAVLAKAVTLIPQALSWVLLPRIAESRVRGNDTGPLLGLGTLLTIVGGAICFLAALALDEPIIRIAFGGDYVDGAYLLAPLIGASTLLGLVMLLMNHSIGRSDHRYVWVVAAIAVIECLAFALFHGSATTLIWIEAAIGLAGIVLYEIISGRSGDGIGRSLTLLAAELRGRRWSPSAM